MLNYGFPPQDPWRGPSLYSFNGPVPSLVTGSPAAFRAVVGAFLRVAANVSAGLEGRPPAVSVHGGEGGEGERRLHTSDMYILQSRPDLYVNLRFPSGIDGPELNKTSLLHFSKATVSSLFARMGVRSKNKSDMVRLIRDFESPEVTTQP